MEDLVNTAEFGDFGRGTRDFSRRTALRGAGWRMTSTRARIRALMLVLACAVVALGFAGCSNQGAKGSGQHASVLLRDGSTLTGTVTANSG